VNEGSLTGRELWKFLLYDLHGEFINSPKYHPGDFAYYEACGSQTPTGYIMRNFTGLSEYEKSRLEIELVEAALTKVLVLDERIQREVLQGVSSVRVNNSSFLEQLRWMNICIPDSDPKTDNVNLNKENFGEEDKHIICNWLSKVLTDERFDFVVIHLGLIERLVTTDSAKIDKFIDEHILVHDDRPRVIITSGRGVSANLPERFSFLHYSNIAKYIIEEKSKFHLVKTLFSARSRKEHYD